MLAHWWSRDLDSVDSSEDALFAESSNPPPNLHCRWYLFACFEKENFALKALEWRQSVRQRKLVYDLEAPAPSAAFCDTPWSRPQPGFGALTRAEVRQSAGRTPVRPKIF